MSQIWFRAIGNSLKNLRSGFSLGSSILIENRQFSFSLHALIPSFHDRSILHPRAFMHLRSIKFKFLGLLLLTGCATIVPTADLNKQPLNQAVQVKGKVITIAPMIKQVAYEVQDDRGTIWILTKKQPPTLDSEVAVTGKVKFESIQAEGEEWGERYLEEE